MKPLARIFTVALVALFVGACAGVGPKGIRQARFDYNTAIIDTRNEQLLTNLVRLRYRDPPYFIEVSSVSTQYVLGARGGLGVGSIGENTVGGVDGGVAYEERPTVTYLPLQGEKFVDSLLSPLPMNAIVLLSHSGWRLDRILRCCVQRVNDIWNAPTASGPTPDQAPEFETFMELAGLLEQLRNAGALELRYRFVTPTELGESRPLGTPERPYVLSLRFHPGPEVSALTARVKELLAGTDPGREEYILTSNPTVRSPNEIGILPRSLMGTMSYLAQAVEPPRTDIEAGRVTTTLDPDGSVFDWTELMTGLFRVGSSPDSPDDAFTRVRYRGTWFYIDDSDLNSKSTFNLLDQLFQLQAGEAGGASPLLTLPLN